MQPTALEITGEMLMDSAVDLLILTGFLSAFYTALALLAALFEWGERLFEAYRGRKPRASRTPKRVAGTRRAALAAGFGRGRHKPLRSPMATRVARGKRKALREATAWEG